MSEEDSKTLLNTLRDLSSAMGRIKSYGEFQNRLSTMIRDEKGMTPGNKVNKLNDEFEEYFYIMIDDGWKYYRHGEQFYSEIRLKKPIKNTDAESELNVIVEEMKEIKSRFESKGFNCHFNIDYDGKGQQETSSLTHKSDVYKFNGIGGKGYLKYSDSISPTAYPRDQYFLAEIKFVYI